MPLLEQSIQRIEQHIVRPREIHAGFRHAAQEQVEGTTQLLVLKIRQPLAQEAAQRY